MPALILAALVVPPALAYVGILGWQLALLAEFAILAVAAWNFDRGRRPGAPGPVWDSARPAFVPPTIGGVRGIPSEAVETPADQTRPARPGNQP
jgi:hypothetical protein